MESIFHSFFLHARHFAEKSHKSHASRNIRDRLKRQIDFSHKYRLEISFYFLLLSHISYFIKINEKNKVNINKNAMQPNPIQENRAFLT